MKSIKILFIILFAAGIMFSEIKAQFIQSGRPIGMGGAFVSVNNDVSAIFHNPAGIADIERLSLLFSYMPVYGVDNLFHYKFTAVIPYLKQRIGLSYYNLSLTEVYSKDEIIAGSGYELNEFLLIGINFKLYTYSVTLPSEETSYKSRLTYLTMDIGFLMHFIKWVDVGMCARNLTDPKIRYSDNSLNYTSQRCFTTGIKFNFTEYFHAMLDQEFKKNESMILKFGSELWFYDTVAIRAGISKNNVYSIGFGVKTEYVNVDFGLQAHKYLGSSFVADITGKF